MFPPVAWAVGRLTRHAASIDGFGWLPAAVASAPAVAASAAAAVVVVVVDGFVFVIDVVGDVVSGDRCCLSSRQGRAGCAPV